MRLNPEKLETLAECLRTVFKAQEFGIGDILARFAPHPMKEPKNRALKGAVRGLMSGRLTKQRLGALFSVDIVKDAVSWRGERWSLEARYETSASAWRYSVVDLMPEIRAEGRQLLKDVQNDALEKALAFEEKLDAMDPVRAFDVAERAVEKQEKRAKREAEREAELILNAENRQLDKLRREHDLAEAEYARISHGNKLFANPYSHGRGEELQRRIREYKAETERLRASSDYARIVGELKKMRLEPSDALVRQVSEIEAKRGGGWHWRAGMSLDPQDYGVVMSAELGLHLGLGGPSTLRDSFQLAVTNWNPFKS